jgi:predicted metalloprotease with PDZ domain
MASLLVVHRVSIPAPQTHLVHVETTVSVTGDGAQALAESLVLFMPVWTPGSYLVREYARHVEGVAAVAPGRTTKIRKNAWRLETEGAKSATVRYRVYAGELTVRTNHVDESHAFLVGAALFLGLEGHEQLGARVEIVVPRGWRASTSLPAVTAVPRTTAPASNDEVLTFEAPDFDTLVDSPIELGTHREERFDVAGKPHCYAIWPTKLVSDADVRRLVADTKTILETEAKLFGGALPYEDYELLLHLAPRGRGGLEHNASAALIASPASFATRDAYLDLLSLVAHEAFHAWNIKRIRPAGLTPYDYGRECYTRLLWWFEGGTSYYDWRVLALARIATVDEYLDHLAAEIAYLDQTPGRLVHALEDASYDAWIKLYRPDENSLNSSVSYYRKGEVVCALLDLEIRARSGGRSSLDTVLAVLWEEYGAARRAVPEDAMQGIFERVAGAPMGDLFDTWIRAPLEIDYGATLARVGLALERTPRHDAAPCSLGVRMRSEGGRSVISTVARESGAWTAGVDAGDELIAIGGMRVEGTTLAAQLRGRAPGDTVDVVVARDGRLQTKTVSLDAPRHDRVKLVAKADASPAARAAFASWLGQPHSGWSGRGDGSAATPPSSRSKPGGAP